METDLEQLALDYPTSRDIEFASTVVESISNSTIISGIKVLDCIDELLPWQVTLSSIKVRFPFFFCLE